MKRFLCLIMVLTLMLSAIPALAFEELAKGSKGDAVIKLQERLNELGYSVGTADGDFGGKTEKAIIQYQKDNGLEETGVLDEITYGALFQDEADNVNAEEKPATVEEEVSPSDIFESLDIKDISIYGQFDLLILTDDDTLWRLGHKSLITEQVWYLNVVDTDVAILSEDGYIKKDGTARIVNTSAYEKLGWREDDWFDISLLAVGYDHVVGLKSDGSWVSAGEYEDGQRDVETWDDIVAIDVGLKHTVGLKSDGTVVATGDNSKGQCDVSSWTDIVKISAYWNNTLGLKADGTVVATGENKNGECDVQSWENVIDISCDGSSFGLTADGEILSTEKAFYRDKYYRVIPNGYRIDNATNICSGGYFMLVAKQDDTIEMFGSEYTTDLGNTTNYCTRLMDVVNNSLLDVDEPMYPSAIIVQDVEAAANASNKSNAQAAVSEAKKEYSENECKEIALAYMKEHISPYLKNPASLQIITVTGGKTEGGEYLFVINYTAMNSFGGYTPGNYYCTVDYATGKVTMGGTI